MTPSWQDLARRCETAGGPDRRRLRTRDPQSGRYAYDGDFDRMCVCGHRLGDHVAGGFDCVAHDVGAATTFCHCAKFRLSRQKSTAAAMATEGER